MNKFKKAVTKVKLGIALNTAIKDEMNEQFDHEQYAILDKSK